MATLQPYMITLPIFILTIYLSLAQPRIGGVRINHAAAALLGAALVLLLLPVSAASVLRSSFEILLRPLITITSLMIIMLIAEEAGLFHRLLQFILRIARGNPRKLFLGLFVSGVLAGSVFTNDAAVLILTPMVCLMIRNGLGLSPIPFLFAVLNVANLVGAFVISNPINIVVAEYVGIEFLDYAKWMLLPALAAAAGTYLILRVIFRREIAESRLTGLEPATTSERSDRLRGPCTVVMVVTLPALFIGPPAGVPVWAVTAAGASALLMLAQSRAGIAPTSILRNVAWDVMIFMTGFFIIMNSLSTAGFSEVIGRAVLRLAGDSPAALIGVTGFLSAICSALTNNHPTAYLMATAIHEITAVPFTQKIMAFAMLIGGDLGPKMLPIGSLAALLWFRILRNHGIEVSYVQYIKIGIPVTLVALVLSLLILIGETILFGPS